MKLLICRLGAPAAQIGDALKTLPAERRTEILRYRGEDDRMRSAIAEIAVRLEIADRLHLPLGRIAISRGETGKPFLVNEPDFRFNISHAGDVAVCAFDEFPIGVDVERIRPVRFRPIADRCFSAREREEIPDSNPLPAFFRIWTAKESVVKQRGATLAADLRALDVAGGVTLRGESLPCTIRSFGLRGEEEKLLPPSEKIDYALSVCVSDASAPHTEVRFCSADALLQEWQKRR